MKIFANLGLNNGTDNIQNLIPESASEQNPLADKKYVDDNAYTLPAASSDTLGGIKVGEGLTMTEDGVLSASGGGGNITYGTEDLIENESVLQNGYIYIYTNEEQDKVLKMYVGIDNTAKMIYELAAITKSIIKIEIEPTTILKSKSAITNLGDKLLISYNGYLYYYSKNLVKGRTSGIRLSSDRTGVSATSVGNHALFAGGCYGSTYYSYVDTFDSDTLIRTSIDNLTTGAAHMGSTNIGNYALFAGGSTYYNNGSYSYTSRVEAYSDSLVKSAVSSNLKYNRNYITGISIGNYALFAGGNNYGGSNSTDNYYDCIDRYTSNLVHSTIYLSVAASSLSATTVGNYVLFAGGEVYTKIGEYDRSVPDVNIFSNNFVKTISNLSNQRISIAAANIKNEYALFAGGIRRTSSSSYKYYAIVDAFSVNLVKSLAENLYSNKNSMIGGSIDKYALFFGEYSDSECYLTKINYV